MIGSGVWVGHIGSLDRDRSWTLTTSERNRAARYRDRGAAAARLVAAELLRQVAGEVLGTAPLDVPVDRTCTRCGRDHGRPRVPGLHASVSHAKGVVAVAVSSTGPIGVDIEDVPAVTPRGVLRAAAADEVVATHDPAAAVGWWDPVGKSTTRPSSSPC